MIDHQDSELARIASRVWENLAASEFRGTDPYDGLNSQILGPILDKSRLLRLVVIQAVKRSPMNLRPLLRVPLGLNPKGLALVLQGAMEWPESGCNEQSRDWLVDALVSFASDNTGEPAHCSREVQEGIVKTLLEDPSQWPEVVGWGYDFPWQSKAFLQPAFFPTVVATSFIVDAIEASGSPVWPLVAAGAGKFVAQELYRYQDKDGICFSYSPGDKTRVFNASLFGARILAQAAPHVPEMTEQWQALAREAVNWVIARQADNGSWIYGEADHWQWIDNLHTGFNLETIDRVARLLETNEWDEHLLRGLSFYRQDLFDLDGTPNYYTTTKWPLDPHSFAQGALTFVRLRHLDPDAISFARIILNRGVKELWDEKKGGFRFQKHPRYTQNIIHMRWSQAWMYRSLCAFLANA